MSVEDYEAGFNDTLNRLNAPRTINRFSTYNDIDDTKKDCWNRDYYWGKVDALISIMEKAGRKE